MINSEYNPITHEADSKENSSSLVFCFSRYDAEYYPYHVILLENNIIYKPN